MRVPSPVRVMRSLQSKKLDNSIQYLLHNRSVLSKYKDVEDFVLRDEEYTTKTQENPKILKACEYHLFQVRRRLAKELWSRDFFLGVSVIDDLLFSTFAHSDGNNPILETLEVIRDSGVLHPGFVVYPLHSLGVVAAGLLYPYTASRLQFLIPLSGVVITPQTNSLEKTASFVEKAASLVGVRKRVPLDLLAHWRRTGLKWLEKNPLLVLRVHSFPGEYYENQFFLVSKLKLATTLILMLNSMQNTKPAREGVLTSTSRSNNWETLDIRHYLVFYPRPYKSELRADCVPMNVSRATLAELSEVSCEIDPQFWRQRIPLSERIASSLNSVGRGLFRYSLGSAKLNTRGRVYRKLFRALDFYRKSYRQREDVGEAAVNLAMAFEILLTDSYSQGVSERMLNRLSSLLKGIRGVRRLKHSIRDLYEARSKYVHAGVVQDSVEIDSAREAFIHAFIAMVSRIRKFSGESLEPIKTLLHIEDNG